MLTLQERVPNALDLLTDGLAPYMEDAFRNSFGDEWENTIGHSFRDRSGTATAIKWDAHSLLTVMWDQWNSVFRNKLTHTDRSLVSELREFRNRWAHQAQFNFDDTYRVLDSVERLLHSVGASQAEEVRKHRMEIMAAEVSRTSSESLLLAKFRKQRLGNVTIYVMCAIAITAALVNSLGWRGWLIATPVAGLFLYFAWQVAREQPTLYGPHECGRCRRIIYTHDCPYCAANLSTSRPLA